MAALPPSPIPQPPLLSSAISSAELVPRAVWPCAQTNAQYQRVGRYLPVSSRHPGKMLPELARRLVNEYCPPGRLVVDPMCGIGTTLVEAAAVGRRAVGVELEPLGAAGSRQPRPRPPARPGRGPGGDTRRLPQLLADPVGQIDQTGS